MQSAETFQIWLLLGTVVTEDSFENLRIIPRSRVLLGKRIIFSASQEIFPILYNPNVHYRVHNSPPLASTRSRNNPIHVSPTYFLKNHFNIILLFTPIPLNPFLSLKFSNEKLYEFTFSPTSACYTTDPLHPPRLDHPHNLFMLTTNHEADPSGRAV